MRNNSWGGFHFFFFNFYFIFELSWWKYLINSIERPTERHLPSHVSQKTSIKPCHLCSLCPPLSREKPKYSFQNYIRSQDFYFLQDKIKMLRHGPSGTHVASPHPSEPASSLLLSLAPSHHSIFMSGLPHLLSLSGPSFPPELSLAHSSSLFTF